MQIDRAFPDDDEEDFQIDENDNNITQNVMFRGARASLLTFLIRESFKKTLIRKTLTTKHKGLL